MTETNVTYCNVQTVEASKINYGMEVSPQQADNVYSHVPSPTIRNGWRGKPIIRGQLGALVKSTERLSTRPASDVQPER